MQSDETRIRKEPAERVKKEHPTAPLSDSSEDEIRIGNYRILEEIGRGGMGVVYLGEQVSLKRQVAIKTLPLEMAHDDEFLLRIENEAKILAKFSNPNIVYIHDRVTQDDAIYLIMEYVPGITVADHLTEEGPYGVDEAARIIIRVAVALEHAHSKGIIHRDIKPSNIMIRGDNVVKVTDFGIAKSSEGSDITRMRFTPGTRDYMSPEQARGFKDIDGRSDIYSLGVVFYRMVTGKLPPYPVPSRLPFIPPLYEKIVLKCLAEDRSQRYQTAKELIQAMDQAKEEATRRKRARQKRSINGARYGPLVAGALVVVLAAGLLIWQLDAIIGFFNGSPKEPPIGPVGGAVTGPQDRPAGEITPQPEPPADNAGEVTPQPMPPIEEKAVNTTPDIADEAQTPGTPEPPVPLNQVSPLSLPVLRPVAERSQETLAAIGETQAQGLVGNPRTMLALKAAVLGVSADNPQLLDSVKTLLEQMDVVSHVIQGGCDLLVTVDSLSQTVVLRSNLFGDDRIEAYTERFSYQDAQDLLARLTTFIRKYYCFNVLASMRLIAPLDPGFAADIVLNGEAFGEIQVGGSIDVCLNGDRKAYFMLLSVNAEGIYLLFPQTRQENVPTGLQKPFCTGSMQVSPPTGAEMIAAILYLDKSLLPVDEYLASEDQVIIEPASWSYDPFSSNSAVDYCERLFASLQVAPPGQYSVAGKFIRTYD